MKIAVMGMGVAGSYLMARLKDTEHEVVGYERNTQQNHDSICAWGTIKPVLEQFCKKVGRNFDDFLIHDGKTMHVKMNNNTKFDIGLHGLCTYDKLGLIKDFIKDSKIIYGKSPSLEELEKEYDMIVDCTGFHRVYLPKLEKDFFLPTYEYKVQYEKGVPYDDFYIEPFPGMSGYFWYFPLENNTAHIGAGDYRKNHVKATDAFLKKHGGKVIATKGRPIRLATPGKCKPFYKGKVVGVGESIGTVYALLGEGIIPSMQCVDIFLENMHDFKAYEKAVDEHYKVYDKVFNFVRAKIHKDFSIIKSLPDFLTIFRYMKKNEERFGMDIKMSNLIKVAKA
ncbi:MAG: NAD(P)/FAD-dependent oxidoreductase [Nitrosopumilaceae archaeon]|nr:NAD(P)/FAD-dependent oxidoreductase [Nitrosopumilaceae archaeon]